MCHIEHTNPFVRNGLYNAMQILNFSFGQSGSWLVEHVLDPGRDGDGRTLDVHVSRLRRKLGEAGRHIVTVWGVGYRLEEGA